MNSANLIIANVRGILFNSAAKNDVRLKYTLGSQVMLVHAITKVIVDEKLIDLKRAEQSINNLRELYSLLENFSIEEAVRITGISEETIRSVSQVLIKPGNCYIVCGKDIEEDPLGNETMQALMNLCGLINAAYSTDADHGKISLLFSRSYCNSQGVNDMGVVPGFFPGYVDIGNPLQREKIEKTWGIKLADNACKKDPVNVFDLALDGKLKALYIMGENPIINYPNGKKIREAFQKVGFIVVQDVFLTETAQLADVVLPTVTFAEKEGTFTNMGMTVQRLNKAIQPVVDARSDWQIICDLAKKMGQLYPYTSPKDIFLEIENTVPIYAGINYDRLKRKEFHWASSVTNRNKPDKYTFRIIQSESSGIKQRQDFPFLLLTGASLNHQGTFSRYSNSLTRVASECFMEINRKDAQNLQVHNGDMVELESSQNKIKLKVKITDKSPEGIVFVSEDYEWVPINIIRDGVYTPVRIVKT
jgi:formate dehydrogenase alpha subunit